MTSYTGPCCTETRLDYTKQRLPNPSRWQSMEFVYDTPICWVLSAALNDSSPHGIQHVTKSPQSCIALATRCVCDDRGGRPRTHRAPHTPPESPGWCHSGFVATSRALGPWKPLRLTEQTVFTGRAQECAHIEDAKNCPRGQFRGLIIADRCMTGGVSFHHSYTQFWFFDELLKSVIITFVKWRYFVASHDLICQHRSIRKYGVHKEFDDLGFALTHLFLNKYNYHLRIRFSHDFFIPVCACFTISKKKWRLDNHVETGK